MQPTKRKPPIPKQGENIPNDKKLGLYKLYKKLSDMGKSVKPDFLPLPHDDAYGPKTKVNEDEEEHYENDAFENEDEEEHYEKDAFENEDEEDNKTDVFENGPYYSNKVIAYALPGPPKGGKSRRQKSKGKKRRTKKRKNIKKKTRRIKK